MTRILVILGLLIAGIGLGGGGAVLFAPEPAATPGAAGPAEGGDHEVGAASDHGAVPAGASAPLDGYPPDADASRSFVPVGRQIIIPVVKGDRTVALMLFEFALDVPAEASDRVHRLAPRLRDAFLGELLAMAHTGAFDATYTDARILDEIRRSLRAAARSILGHEAVAGVLVLDIMRQEL